MDKHNFKKRYGIVRSAIKEDLLQFGLPAIVVFSLGLVVCTSTGWDGFLGTVWDLIRNPEKVNMLSSQDIAGMAIITFGFIILFVSVFTLRMNYASTLVIRANHQLITRGIYRLVRHPIYFGVILITIGVPVHASSLYGLLIMLVLIPIFINRIRLEEKLLIEAFGDDYRAYMASTRKLIPFIY